MCAKQSAHALIARQLNKERSFLAPNGRMHKSRVWWHSFKLVLQTAHPKSERHRMMQCTWECGQVDKEMLNASVFDSWTQSEIIQWSGGRRNRAPAWFDLSRSMWKEVSFGHKCFCPLWWRTVPNERASHEDFLGYFQSSRWCEAFFQIDHVYSMTWRGYPRRECIIDYHPPQSSQLFGVSHVEEPSVWGGAVNYLEMTDNIWPVERMHPWAAQDPQQWITECKVASSLLSRSNGTH